MTSSHVAVFLYACVFLCLKRHMIHNKYKSLGKSDWCIFRGSTIIGGNSIFQYLFIYNTEL